MMTGAVPLKGGGRHRSVLSVTVVTFFLCAMVGLPTAYVLMSTSLGTTPELEALSRKAEAFSHGRSLLQVDGGSSSGSPDLTVTPLTETSRQVQSGPPNCPAAATACYNANGSLFVCCPGGCPVPPGDTPFCVGDSHTPSPATTHAPVCGGGSPNPCYAADGLSFVCCPGLCGTPPGIVAYCAGANAPTGTTSPVVNSPTTPPSTATPAPTTPTTAPTTPTSASTTSAPASNTPTTAPTTPTTAPTTPTTAPTAPTTAPTTPTLPPTTPTTAPTVIVPTPTVTALSPTTFDAAATPSPVTPTPTPTPVGAIPQVVVPSPVPVNLTGDPIGAVKSYAPVTIVPAPPSSPAMCLDSSDVPVGPGNVIQNPGFANGLPTGWTYFGPATVAVSSDSTYVAATGRQMTYAGPAWEIAPSALSPGGTFTGQAWVQLSSEHADVDLTLLVIKNGEHNFFRVGSVSGTSGCWQQITGTITIQGGADQLFLYAEGPPPGTDLYVRSAALFPAVTGGQQPGTASAPGLMCIGSSRDAIAGTNLVDDSRAQIGWTCAGCIFNFSSDHSYTIATARGATYSGPTWNLNGKLSVGKPNALSVWVQLGAQVTSAAVKLTAKKSQASEVEYLPVDEAIAYAGCWTQLAGMYTLAGPADQVAIYAEGPAPGVELWVAQPAVFVPGAYGAPVPKVPQNNVCPGSRSDPITGTNLIYSTGFYGGAPGGWSCFGCELVVNPLAQSYITATGRTASWNGPAWILTGNIGQGSTYSLQVTLRVSTGSAPVQLTLKTSLNGQGDSYFPVAAGTASTGCWTQLNGTFTLTSTADMVVMYVEGPPPGTNVDIMVAAVVLTVPAATIRPTPSNVCPDSLNVPPPVNSIVENPGFDNGIPPTWLPFGSCQLTVSPDKQYITASQRAQTFAGPSWDVTKYVRAGNFYRFSAWVSLPAGASTTRVLYGVAVTKNGATTYSCAGQRSITGGCWSQLNGGYNQYTDSPDKVVIYMQGPAPGVDILVQSVNVEPITRDAWLHDVTIRADRIRKTNVVVNVQDENGNPVPNAQIKIDQTKQGFPLGTAINYQLPSNPAYQNFVKTRFNWVVFENEAKWYYNEPQQGQYNYAAPDAMVAWANANNILLRGHCGFWEDTQTVQPWVRALDDSTLKAAMAVRLNQVADRYRGQFKHWDVDNEALHNTYFSGRLGPSIQSWMYAMTQELDPSVEMFINEYNVLEECDPAANPETFIGEAQNLEAQGFQISFGCQSHFGNPVQAFKLRADLDKLASFGRPIWITEMDSAEVDENKKADMLEFAYREYFAHPGVEGILLWTVWEGPNVQCQVCTVNGDFSNKPSGARIDQLLLNEWRTTGVVGQTDSSGSPFIFRGFYGDYNAQVTVNGQTYQVPFTVFKEENGNAVYLTVPVSGGGRRKLLSAAERGQRNLRRSALTSPERKLPSSYLTALVPGDELRDWDEPSVKNPVRHSVRDSEDPRWEDPPARPARSILSRQQLDAAVAAHEPDGYAPVEEVRTAQRLDTARANHRTLLESQAGELEARHVSIPSGVSRQDYDAASFKNRELLQVNDDLVNDPVNDPCLDSTDELLGSAALDMASTGPGFRELLELREDPVIDPGLELTDGGNGVSRSLLKLGPMHAYLGLGKGFDYVRLELEGDSTRPNDSVKAPEGGENGPQRRLLEVEEAEADKSEYLDTLMFHGGDLARNDTEALVAFLRAEKMAVRTARGRTRR